MHFKLFCIFYETLLAVFSNFVTFVWCRRNWLFILIFIVAQVRIQQWGDLTNVTAGRYRLLLQDTFIPLYSISGKDNSRNQSHRREYLQRDGLKCLWEMSIGALLTQVIERLQFTEQGASILRSGEVMICFHRDRQWNRGNWHKHK